MLTTMIVDSGAANAGFTVALNVLWAEALVMIQTKLLPAAVIGLLGIWIIRTMLKLLGRLLERSNLEKAAHSLIKSVAAVVMYVLLGLMVASRLGIDVTGVIALASVLTLAVSLAVENALANVFGGFTLIYTQPFHSSDYVEIAGQSGTVKEIGLAYTKLATPDNKVISIPNSAVTSAQIVNYSTADTRRLDFNISASYDTPAEAVKEALLKAAQVENVLEDPAPFVGVLRYGEYAVEYVLRLWAPNSSYWDVTFAINERIKAEFDGAGLRLTYPHLNVHLDK